MKRLLFAVCLLFGLGLASCQCAEGPEIGPVEGEEEARAAGVLSPEAPAFG